MRIVTNEYRSSLPGSQTKIKGGPARFAMDFSKFIISQHHEWIGLIHTNNQEQVELMSTSDNKIFYGLSFPSLTLEGLREVDTYENPSVLLKEEIATTARLMKELKPDLLFLNGFSAYAWVLFAAARCCAVPVVIQHAGIFVREVEEYKDLFTEAGQKICRKMEQEVSEFATANIFLNTWSAEQFKTIVEPTIINNSVIIPLPHAGQSFSVTIHPKQNDTKNIGIVARWDRIKNHDAVLALADAIDKEKLPWHITAVTTIPNTNTKKEFKIRYQEKIEVIPFIDRESIIDFYRSHDIMILPSHFDVSPTVVMEALSAGTPTLISDHAGWVSEYATHNMQDWIADFSHPDSIITILKKQFSRSDWKEIGPFAHYIKEYHDPHTVFTQYLELFNNTLTR